MIIDAVISGGAVLILLSVAWSVKSDVGGTIVGFDFTWLRELFIRKEGRSEET